MPVEPKPLTLEIVTHHAGGCPAEYKNVGVSASVKFLDNIVTENSLVTDAKGAISAGLPVRTRRPRKRRRIYF